MSCIEGSELTVPTQLMPRQPVNIAALCPPSGDSVLVFQQLVLPRYFQSAKTASLSWLHLFLPTSCLPKNAWEEVIPCFCQMSASWYCRLFFVMSRVWDCTLICCFHTESSLAAATWTELSMNLRQHKKSDVTLLLHNCNYNLDLMRLLHKYVY